MSNEWQPEFTVIQPDLRHIPAPADELHELHELHWKLVGGDAAWGEDEETRCDALILCR